jgi:DNA-binding response OmpR family regulator
VSAGPEHDDARAAPRVLVVEDDAPLRAMVASELRQDGYHVDEAGGVGEALLRAEDDAYDLILLDLNLPDGDGIEVAERLRGRVDVPIVMLTARADLDSRLEGLYAGAADYVVKPFALPELRARVHARLRERRGPDLPRHEDLVLDPATSRVTASGGEVELPVREFTLLRLFIEHPGRLFSRDDLERRLYGPDEVPASNTVEVFVHHLRKKLDAIDARPRIRTVRGKGYLLR